MEFSKDSFFEAAVSFRTRLLEDLKARGWTIPAHWWIDHLCYRVETIERYGEVCGRLGDFAELLTESEVNGRPISTFRLEEALPGHDENLRIIEVPAPKPGKVVREGFEHAEIVCDEPFSDVKKRFPGAVFDEGGLKKTFNRELEIVLGPRNVKFHHLSLESVVNLEGNGRVFGALQRSRVLEIAAAGDPLVAGTFPLSLTVASSDIDILVTETGGMEEILRSHFSSVPGFETKRGIYRGTSAVVMKFAFEDVPFEIFLQTTPSVRQTAYRHFQIEERLLDLFGEPLIGRIRNLRSAGEKTEPAFAKALDLKGDSYEALLKLHAMPVGALRDLFPLR